MGFCLILQQLSDSLLEMEEEKAIWFSKEKASIEVIEEKGAEMTAMTKAMSEVSYKIPLKEFFNTPFYFKFCAVFRVWWGYCNVIICLSRPNLF
jgi:hypothetical protein